MTDERDTPIEAQEFVSGVKVVDIGDVRVARGLTRRPHSACRHKRLIYDPRERRIWCRDCERDVEPFDAFTILVEQMDAAIKGIGDREKRLVEAEAFNLRTLAAKALDEAWRSRNMVPACPHCSNGLFPEHFKNGVHASLSREYAQARIDAAKKNR